MTERIAPLRHVKIKSPQTQRRKGLPPPLYQKPTDTMERFPSGHIRAHTNMTARISPPCRVAHRHNGEGNSVASKTLTDKRRGFPTHHVKAHMNTTGRISSPHCVGKEPTDTTEKGFPFSCIKKPTQTRQRGFPPCWVKAHPNMMGPLHHVGERTHRRGENPSPLHQKPCRCEEPTEEGKSPRFFGLSFSVGISKYWNER